MHIIKYRYNLRPETILGHYVTQERLADTLKEAYEIVDALLKNDKVKDVELVKEI